jgi:PAS domain-containing protein
MIFEKAMFSDTQAKSPRLLLCSKQDSGFLQSQMALFESSGYPVTTALTSEEIERQARGNGFEIAVLNHTLPLAERKRVARKIKEHDWKKGVLVLHASGASGNPHADAAVDSRSGASEVLSALKKVEVLRSMRMQHADEDKMPIVVVDPDRNYIFANDPACRLVGFDHAEFLQLRIDEIVVGGSQVVQPLFNEFVAEGTQKGTIKLRHRSGSVIAVQYEAQVRPDGYMMARWAPINDSAGAGAGTNESTVRPSSKD